MIPAAPTPSTRVWSKSRNLTALVGVRLLPQEHAQALALADARGLTVASLLRSLLQAELERT